MSVSNTRAVTAALAVAVLLAGCTTATPLDRGAALYRQGKFPEAVQAFD